MTCSEAIMKADELKANVYSDEQKMRWLSELDGKIIREVLEKDTEVCYSCPEDENRELIVGLPYCDIYVLYLCAMIDFSNRETAAYENSMIMFNSSYDVFAKNYIRNNMPKSGGTFKNFI